FANVSDVGEAGVTTVVNPTATLPTNFRLSDGLTYAEVAPSAATSGSITTCLPYRDDDNDGFVDDIDPPMADGDLQILHAENGTFVDRTVSNDLVRHVICAETSSLSEFAVGAGPTTTTSTTTTTTTTLPTAANCPPSPADGCQSASSQKASIALGTGATPAHNKLVWKWTSSGTVAPEDFGEPTATTGYDLCVYDQRGRIASATVPADGQCGTKPCWKPSANGAKYKNS